RTRRLRLGAGHRQGARRGAWRERSGRVRCGTGQPLRRAPASRPRAFGRRRAAGRTTVKSARALVVDDDPVILEVLEMRLHSMGLDVALAKSHGEAITLLDERGFDVALFDLRMEPVSGLKLMAAAHERQPRLPVLIMTAHGTIDNAVEAVRQGAFDYLTKPFVRDELRTKIERALTTRRWARDRERLLTVGQTLASSGIMERVLDSVAQATVAATE